MKIDFLLTTGPRQPGGNQPTGYTVNLQRSDGETIDRLEAFSVLQTALDALCNGVEDSFGTIHAGTNYSPTDEGE